MKNIETLIDWIHSIVVVAVQLGQVPKFGPFVVQFDCSAIRRSAEQTCTH